MSVLYVFIGGGLGSVLRYLLSKWMPYTDGFPWATFIANVLACIILGVLVGLMRHRQLGIEWYALAGVGLCGGFSTFSTFSLETLQFIEEGKFGMMFVYLCTSWIIGVASMYAAISLLK